MELANQPQKPSALKDWAYHTIKEAILNFQFPPGVQLHIEELSAQLGTSRTPVRDALARLEGDGLVHTVPRVGYFVTAITRRDLEELFELRALLESYAAKRAAAHMTDDDLAHLDRLLEDSNAAVERGELAEFLHGEIALHTFITEQAHNRRLVEMMESLRDLTYRERVLSLKSLENVQQSCVEHQKIVEALHQRNSDLAGKCMWEHIWAVRERMLQFTDLPESEDSASSGVWHEESKMVAHEVKREA